MEPTSKNLRAPWRLEHFDGWYVEDAEGNLVCDIGGFGVDDEEDLRLGRIGCLIEEAPNLLARLIVAVDWLSDKGVPGDHPELLRMIAAIKSATRKED